MQEIYDDEFTVAGEIYQIPLPSTDEDEEDEFTVAGDVYDIPVSSPENENENDNNSENTENDYSNCIKLLVKSIKPRKYLYDRSKMWSIEEEFTREEKNNLEIPLVIDTEFTTLTEKKWKQQSRKPLTTQIRGIHPSSPSIIFAHKTSATQINLGRSLGKLKSLPILKTNFNGVDYLKHLGIEIEIKTATKNYCRNLPKAIFTLYAHFATAELNIIFQGSLKEKIKELQRNLIGERIESGRRLRCVNPTKMGELDYVELDHIIIINNEDYSLAIRVVDTAGLHGVASYDAIAKAVGWILQFKDTFTPEQKSRMLDMAIERAKDFENYSLGDLDVYEILEKYSEQMSEVYEKLRLLDYYKEPQLTIGGTVKNLFLAALAQFLGFNTVDGNDVEWVKELNEEVINPFLVDVSAAELRQYTKETKALLAKVEGGRCRNNRPTDISFKREFDGSVDSYIVCDIDISGCYGEGQRNQIYPIGKPEILSFNATSKNNDYPSLRRWLKEYDVQIEKLVSGNENEWTCSENWGELKNGCWNARFSSKNKLKYPQDFFASWFTTSGNSVNVMAKFISQMKCDSEQIASPWVDFDEEEGFLKIFNYEIHNSVITHDGLEWLLKIASPRQRNDILDNCYVLTSIVYPASQEIQLVNGKESLDELKKIHSNWSVKNQAERIKRSDGKKSWRYHDGEPHLWFGINLGKLLIDDLLIQRKIAQKIHGKKSPLDVLFKLCVNTLYGDMVSKYFVVANPVVGNNITGRARALAWYMEKGLHGHQSITDGCAFEVNKVLYPNRNSINGETINQHRDGSSLKQRKISRKPLGNLKSIQGISNNNESLLRLNHQDGTVKDLNLNQGMTWIDSQAMQHLQSIFPLVNVLHQKTTKITIDENLEPLYKPRIGQFSFETKDLYLAAAFHGSANYLLWNESTPVLKARGYETKKTHTSIAEEDEQVFKSTERYGKSNNPAKDFLINLLKDPEKLPRQVPAVRQGILKVGDYKNLSAKYDALRLEPGDNILRPLLMQEFSLSQFTFQTYEQYHEWLKIITKYKNKNRQSLETFFLNEDGTLNMVEMCETIDRLIAENVMNPFEALDKHRNRKRGAKRSKNQTKSPNSKGKNQTNSKKILCTIHPYQSTYDCLCEKLKTDD